MRGPRGSRRRSGGGPLRCSSTARGPAGGRGTGGRAAVIAAAAALALLLAACGESYRGEPLRGPFPTAASAAAGAASEALLEEGERVFARYCHQCHPGGAGGLAPALNNKPAPGWLVRFQVRNGMGAMPAFPRERIAEDELDALVEYVLELRRHGSE